MDTSFRKKLSDAQTILVKIGTSTLANGKGKIDRGFLADFCRELATLQQQGKQLILVSSGAVAAGSECLGKVGKLHTIPEKQAAAAVGQNLLMHEYERMFQTYGVTIAQVLLTRDAIADRHRYINVRHTFEQLLALKVIPIINENDVVAVDEMKWGDNDTLAALVASLVGVDLIIFLTQGDGLLDEGERRISVVEQNLASLREDLMARNPTKSQFGTGGIVSKLEAVQLAVSAGIPAIIAHGRDANVLEAILAGEDVGTLFMPREDKLESRKRWLAHGLVSTGSLQVDQGAKEALVREGKSLLPVGVLAVVGSFEPGDLVRILFNAREIARGLTNYSSDDMQKVKGKRAKEIEKILGYHYGDEVIHRDNLVLV